MAKKNRFEKIASRLKKNKYLLNFLLLSLSFFSYSSIVFASDDRDFGSIVYTFIGILDLLIPVIIGATLIVFFWGLAKFLMKMDDENERANGKKLMLWGIIALFVMVSIWGILEILSSSIGFQAGLPILPE